VERKTLTQSVNQSLLLSCVVIGGCQLLIESYSSSGPYSIRTAVKAAFIQLLTVFVNKLGDVAGRLVSSRLRWSFLWME